MCGEQGIRVVFAQNPAAAVQRVLVQVTGCPHLTKRAQIEGQARRRGQGIGVVLTQDPAAAVQRIPVQVTGCLYVTCRA